MDNSTTVAKVREIDTQDIRDHYRRGFGHWFDADTLRFFRSRVGGTAYNDGERAYFVSSEQYDWNSPRLYSVRCYIWATREIYTVGEFQAYASRNGAHAAAYRLALAGSGATVGV